MTQRSLLLVHAHPDDETIGSGVTMAKYAAAGADVCLVTCTLGEEGEVLVPELEHLAADRQDQLGEHRLTEFAEAMKALGVTDYRLLGGPGRYRDSGMMGTPANDRPGCFWQADLLEAATYLVATIRQQQPQVLVTYDDFGGYGHPDHIQAHRVAMYAAVLAEAPGFRPDLGAAWRIQKIYWTAFPRSVVAAGIEQLRALGDTSDFAAMDPGDIPFAVEDDLVTTVVEADAFMDQKRAALRAYPTQISLDGGFFALSNNLGSEVLGAEFFRLVRGRPGPDRDDRGRETDLFSGVLLGADDG